MENETVVKSKETATEIIDDEREEDSNISAIDFKMVTFSLAGKDYAIDIMKVKEIAKAGRFTYVPNALPFVLGVYNLRGDIIPIVDLRLFFNIDVPVHEEGTLENMIIVTVGDQTFGIVVDGIDKVVGIQKNTIQPPHPLFGDINIKYIYGVVESNNRLYILLDVDRIFGTKVTGKGEQKQTYYRQADKNAEQDTVNEESSGQVAVSGKEGPVKETVDEEYGFVVDSLKNMKQFYVSPLNEKFVQQRYTEWVKLRGKDKVQFKNSSEADEFLKPFWSQGTGEWWSQQLADEVFKLLPDNGAHQIIVWNPGCGKGYESFSLACLLHKRYPSAKIKIYAHDIDLLNVSNAPLLTISPQYAKDWYAPFVTKKASGEYTFSQEIKDMVMFEYHDCVNTNALPIIDIIFARDVLSLLLPDAQKKLIMDFSEKLKGNGIAVLGDHESLTESSGWTEKKIGDLALYSKK